jgi:hypothetical protein
MEAPGYLRPSYAREEATFAEVITTLEKIVELDSDLKDLLENFRIFLETQEIAVVCR